MNQNIDELHINKIFLMMGPACNFHCRYCLQTPIKKSTSNISVSSALYAYLDHLIKVRDPGQKLLHIIFWGGEPLLYWNIIQEFVLHYQDKLIYGIISNGSLLTQDKVDFLNQHGISFTLSHDGANTDKTRNKDVLKDENTLALIQQMYPTLNAVISGYNQDLNTLFDYWTTQYPSMPGHVEMLRVTWNMPNDVRNVDLTMYRNGLKKFFTDAIHKISTNEWGNKAAAAIDIVQKIHIQNDILICHSL